MKQRHYFLISLIVNSIYFQTSSGASPLPMKVNPMSKFTLTSSSFSSNESIPARHTCDGENISPELSWENAPKNTKSFALIVDDPDAPQKVFVHWIIFNIPATTKSLAEGTAPSSAVMGMNDFKQHAWGGPCPPRGTHRYYFTLYALDTMLDLSKKISKEELLAAMEGHLLGKAELIGQYSQKK